MTSLKELQKALDEKAKTTHWIYNHYDLSARWVQIDDVQKALSVFQVGRAAKEHVLRDLLKNHPNPVKPIGSHYNKEWIEQIANEYLEWAEKVDKAVDEAFSEKSEFMVSCESCLFQGCTESVCLNCGTAKHHYLAKSSDDQDFVCLNRKQLDSFKLRLGGQWAWYFYQELGYRITDSDEDAELLKKAMDKILKELLEASK